MAKDDKEINIKDVKKRVKTYVKDHGLEEAHTMIKKDYKYHPEMRKKLLFILYLEYDFYPFKHKEKLDNKKDKK